ncbi:Glucosamine-6-phosphate isomerase (Glucosamine-6-phosphate deaminase) (GNPDA) (GlcN6P deaminase) [Spiromyces aspiralis]|uniref:Glucosamine-6-phosphate isomerase (Glucosamine-6-phosphate deaminase) (GNPDA) (GlcN6P deaminase) n=1 Tax=Spiromyces aspiralis TaxID=68401 RepID=A0ACC1HIL2_9FUNG|nr:Glucosamine-6-phosphate isomerase (Glucosamine-6-phosphate deaminase) (GNPDA) (GlcN6P deaminase) [Spiromyces aspiralis]
MKTYISVLGLLSLASTALALWPIPRNMSESDKVSLAPTHITTGSSSQGCPSLQKLVLRYGDLISGELFTPPDLYLNGTVQSIDGSVSYLEVNIRNVSDFIIDLDTDESYELDIPVSGKAQLNANTYYGALRGLETYSQLLTNDGHGRRVIRNTPIKISDSPYFPHRGILFDTARNYYSVDAIKHTIDAMSYNKLNVLHWHIVDSQSWPVESKLHPQLADNGAYSPQDRYSYSDVKDIIQYAKDRGVRVIPEFDMPGHTYIIGKSFPDIMSCLNVQPKWSEFAAEPPSGQLDITNPKALSLAKDIIKEYSALFPDSHFHVGGDEVNMNCWEKSNTMQDYLAAHSGATVNHVLKQFYQGIHDTIIASGKVGFCWEETIFHQNFTVPKGTAVQSWIDSDSVRKTVMAGYNAIASPYEYYYLDCGHGGWLSDVVGNSWCDPYKSWSKVYSYNPLANITNPEHQKRVLGGEVALWAEQSDEHVMDSYLWPRSSAHAEILWSGPIDPKTNKQRAPIDAITRLHAQRYRMLGRGIRGAPLQPLWCAQNPGNCSA